MECNHKAKFKFKMLFSRNVSYICRNCGAELEFTPLFATINKAVNFLFVGGLIFFAFTQSGTSDNSSTRLIIYLSIMTGLVLLYMFIQFLMISFGMYQEKVLPPVETPENTDKEVNSEASKAAYTKEQQEIIDLYAYYEKKNRDEAAEASEAQKEPVPEEIPCENHVPVKNWRTYMPGANDFICESCGKTITFVKEQKRQLNMILLVFSLLVMAGSFYIPNVLFWQLVLMAVGTLIICIIVQYFFVKKGRFELKEEAPRK
jgi:uncharacterized protein (DUF983 family)